MLFFLACFEGLYHFSDLAAGDSDGGYAPLHFARSLARVSADEDRYSVMFEYTAQVTTKVSFFFPTRFDSSEGICVTVAFVFTSMAGV